MEENRDDIDNEPEEPEEVADDLESLLAAETGAEEPTPDAGEGQLRLVLLDVQAVAEGSDPLRTLWQESPAEAAARLVDLLSWAMAADDAELVLVMERSVSSPGILRGTHGMRVQLTAPRQSVTEAMFEALEGIRNLGRPATVVTSNIDIIRRAYEYDIQSVLGDLFAVNLLGGASSAEEDDFTEPPGLTEKEHGEWQAFVARWAQEKKK